MKTVCNEFGLLQNIDNFRLHYLVSRNLFKTLLLKIYESLRLGGTGPYNVKEPQKQLLVCLWYRLICRQLES